MKHRSTAMAALLFTAALAAAPALAGRDPFARPALPAPAPTDAQAMEAAETVARPQLRAIMVAPNQALANISGHILAVGEWFGDYKVVRIRERSVTLATRGGAKSELTLEQANNK